VRRLLKRMDSTAFAETCPAIRVSEDVSQDDFALLTQTRPIMYFRSQTYLEKQSVQYAFYGAVKDVLFYVIKISYIDSTVV